jgi:hypothetical protein
MRGLITYGLMAVLSLGSVGVGAEPRKDLADAIVGGDSIPARYQIDSIEEARALLQADSYPSDPKVRRMQISDAVREFSEVDGYAILVDKQLDQTPLDDKTVFLLQVYKNGLLFRSYVADVGSPGDKEIRGDRKTPEGLFSSFSFSSGRYGDAILINYPNREDAKRGIEDNLITPAEAARIDHAISNGGISPQDTDLGGYIEIHNGGTGSVFHTTGCVALRDNDQTELLGILGPIYDSGVDVKVGVIQ